jgi:alpha-glucosidase (family GH31 glycosyl hydrolase)
LINYFNYKTDLGFFFIKTIIKEKLIGALKLLSPQTVKSFTCAIKYSYFMFSIFIIIFFNITPAQTINPVADPKAIVINNEARFTVLTSQMIRLEWSEDKKFEDQATLVFINRSLPVPQFVSKVEINPEGSSWLIIQTEKMKLSYKVNSGSFNSENLNINFEFNNSLSTWHPGIKDTANLFGTIRTLDAIKGATPLDPGILSRDGWTLIDDSKRPLFVENDWDWVLSRPEGNRQDWYFFGYGHDYKKQLNDFTEVAGKIPMPPKFAFGVWWSRYWNYTDEELIDLVNQFNTFGVPLDVLVVDMDWHLTQDGKWNWGKLDQAGLTFGWTGYTWNENYFPDPKAFLDWTERKGLKVTLNLHPASGIQPHEMQYKKMAEVMGINPESKKYVPFDITEKKFAKNYFDIVIHPLEKMGVDFWWLDWQQWHTTAIPGVTPTWWLNYVFFSDMERQKKRPILFHRWGGLGNHRYQIGFSGDVVSSWESLSFQIYFTLTASNVGFGYWSHDIGGHMPGPVTPELYTRWIQFGVFSPILRTHSSKNPLAERRIWGYPYEYFKVMREAFLLRHSLIPYIYTGSRQAYDTGMSLIRPMYYDYPESDEAYEFKEQYMFCNDILAAPITSPIDSISLLASKEIWLPEGEWFEWFTGTILKGPTVIKRNFSLEEIPIFVKAGAIIPMQLTEEPLDKAVNPLVLSVFPGDSGSVKIYEDDGNSLGYKSGEFSRTIVLHHKEKNGNQRIEIFPVEGYYKGMLERRSYKIILNGVLTPQKIVCNGKELEWKYDGTKLTASVLLPEFNTSEKIEITVQPSKVNLYEIVNGFPGKLSRIKDVKNLINSKSGLGNVSLIISMAQTGRRISLHPDNAVNELIDFHKNLNSIKRELELLGLSPDDQTRYLNHLDGI